ncbi:MAG TPA: hypothetical protein VGK29_17245 [Paludibaculum sp.]|jgi:hypothetical protein
MMTTKFNSIFRAAALTAALALAMPVFGQATQTRVNIPLAFEMGKDSMPAGDYVIQANSGSWQMLITDPTGAQRVIMTIPVGNPKTPLEGKLVFQRLGSTYRLAEVYLAGAPTGVQIPATKAQIELAKRQKTERFEVAMIRR